jgi:uncharacterized membrane protein YkvA (DUF1232 family)
LPAGIRVRLWFLFAYLAFPIDIVPDFLPIIGYADDVILVLLVVRSVVRRAGRDVVRRHWSGTAEGFEALCRAAGIPPERAA